MNLIVEDGSIVENANTYVDLAYANAYIDSYPDAYVQDWLDSDDDAKSKALVLAARWIDLNIDFYGEKQTLEQSMAWPRVNARYSNGIPIPKNFIPSELKLAQCEIAIMIASGDFLDSPTGAGGLNTVNIGGIISVSDNADSSFSNKLSSYASAYLKLISRYDDSAMQSRRICRV